MATEARRNYLMVDIGMLQAQSMQETYLLGLLSQAEDLITRRGVTLTAGDADDMLVAMVAGWMYRARASAEEKRLPTYLRQQINDRLAAQKMGGGEA